MGSSMRAPNRAEGRGSSRWVTNEISSYARYGNPTVAHGFEDRISDLLGDMSDCFGFYPLGMAACRGALTSALKAGDFMCGLRRALFGLRACMCEDILARFGRRGHLD